MNRAERLRFERQLAAATKELRFYRREFSRRIDLERIASKAVAEIAGVLPVVKPVTVFPIKDGQTADPETVVALFSDLQGGEKIDKDETGGLGGGYNLTILADRMAYYAEKVIRIVKLHRTSTPIKRLALFMLGDNVEGIFIFRGQAGWRSEPLAEQFMTVYNLIVSFLMTLAPHFEQIDAYTIYGNHGRHGGIGESLYWDNNDYIIYRMLEQNVKQENLKFHVTKSWWQIADVMGWKFLLIHGEDIRKWLSIFAYGAERADANYSKVLRAVGRDFSYMVHGHHHLATDWDTPMGERISNGSFAAGNPWAAKTLVQYSRPTQVIFGVHKGIGVTWRYKIRLDKAKGA